MTNPKLEVLTPQNSQLIFIDHQPQMAFGVQSIDRQTLKNNVVALAKAAKVFNVPTTITTVETAELRRLRLSRAARCVPRQARARAHVDELVGRQEGARCAQGKQTQQGDRLGPVDGGVQQLMFALSAMLEGGYEIYMVADASGGTSKEAHDYSMQRMIQAGVVPVTWQQVLLEWQRDWARKETYDAVHGGRAASTLAAYGMGVD